MRDFYLNQPGSGDLTRIFNKKIVDFWTRSVRSHIVTKRLKMIVASVNCDNLHSYTISVIDWKTEAVKWKPIHTKINPELQAKMPMQSVRKKLP